MLSLQWTDWTDRGAISMVKPEPGPLYLDSIEVENFKRITWVRIDALGNVIQINGENGVGKSSLLDAVFTALKGKAVSPPRPIQDGAERAHIRIELGDGQKPEFIVTRTFRRALETIQPEGTQIGWTTELRVESADGGKFSRGQ